MWAAEFRLTICSEIIWAIVLVPHVADLAETIDMVPAFPGFIVR